MLGHEARRTKRAVRKQFTACGPVSQFQSLPGAQQVNGVVAHHVTTAHGVEPQLMVGPEADLPYPPVDIFNIAAGATHGVRESTCRAARCVQLTAMVDFDDLGIITAAEPPQRMGHELREHLDPKTHVGGPQHRNGLRSLLQSLPPRTVQTCRSTDNRQMLARRYRQESRYSRRYREVYDAVGSEQARTKVGSCHDPHRSDTCELTNIPALAGVHAGTHSANNRKLGRVVGKPSDRKPHSPGCPVK